MLKLNNVSALSKSDLIETVMRAIPQKPPFRFIDKIHDLNENEVISEYTFKKDEWFYQGHFPEFPVTPGVILTEMMCQAGVIPLAFLQGDLSKHSSVPIALADTEVEFDRPVFPGETIQCHAKKMFWRFNKIRASVELKNADNQRVASGVISGMRFSR